MAEVDRDGLHAIFITADIAIDALKEKFIPLLRSHWAHLRLSSFDTYDGDQAKQFVQADAA